MTQEIIDMAKEAGLTSVDKKSQYLRNCLERFANLVAAKEREACAKRAEIALLGTLKTTSDRVLKAIRARGEA